MVENEFLRGIREYQERHPEVEEILRNFGIAQEAYERALSRLTLRVARRPTYTLTTEGSYNANVSKLAR